MTEIMKDKNGNTFQPGDKLYSESTPTFEVDVVSIRNEICEIKVFDRIEKIDQNALNHSQWIKVGQEATDGSKVE